VAPRGESMLEYPEVLYGAVFRGVRLYHGFYSVSRTVWFNCGRPAYKLIYSGCYDRG
jgi:hypothetical protein